MARSQPYKQKQISNNTHDPPHHPFEEMDLSDVPEMNHLAPDDPGLLLQTIYAGLGVGLALVASFCQAGFALVGAGGFRSVPSLQSAALLRTFSAGIYAFLLVPLLILLGQGSTITDPLDSPEAVVTSHFLQRFRDECQERGATFVIAAIAGAMYEVETGLVRFL